MAEQEFGEGRIGPQVGILIKRDLNEWLESFSKDYQIVPVGPLRESLPISFRINFVHRSEHWPAINIRAEFGVLLSRYNEGTHIVGSSKVTSFTLMLHRSIQELVERWMNQYSIQISEISISSQVDRVLGGDQVDFTVLLDLLAPDGKKIPPRSG